MALKQEDIVTLSRSVGYALRDRRVAHGWLLKDAAELTGMSLPVLSRLECGLRPITMQRLIALCDAYGTVPSAVVTQAEREAFPLGWPGDNGTGTTR